jgi:hypothetical protein
MTGSLQTPLARLVLFMICLSVVGSVVAGGYYFAAVQPDQKALHSPANRVCDYEKCVAEEMRLGIEYREKNGWDFCPACPTLGIDCETPYDNCDCDRDPCAYGNG